MGPIRVGALRPAEGRTGTSTTQTNTILSTATSSTTHPNTTNPTDPWRPHGDTRSRDCWIKVSNATADAGISITVSLYGSNDPDTTDATQALAGSWGNIGILNLGAAILPATGAATSATNKVAYWEIVPDLLAYRYIHATITGTVAQTVLVKAYGEQS